MPHTRPSQACAKLPRVSPFALANQGNTKCGAHCTVDQPEGQKVVLGKYLNRRIGKEIIV